MASTVVINGQDVHVGWIVMNTLWVAVSLALLSPLAMQLYRLRMLLKHSENPSVFHGACVQWANVTLIWLCYFVSGVDVSHAYFDESRAMVALLLGELPLTISCGI